MNWTVAYLVALVTKKASALVMSAFLFELCTNHDVLQGVKI
jgi:hypothetical protein